MPNPVTVNILDTYYMAGLWEGLSPVPSFFKDRYFPTNPGDIFAADKVLVEYRDGDYGMAPFMVESADPINVSRGSYEIHDYSPLTIKQSRNLTADQLKQRGFGEAILSGSTEEERAAGLVSEDLALLERRFARSEELLCVNTILNNGFQVNEMVDANNVGNVASVKFYDPNVGNDGAYTINPQWTTSTDWADIEDDVVAMCESLSERGLPAQDLVIGNEVKKVFLANADFRELVNKTSGIIIANEIRQALTAYHGVSVLGAINFGGYVLNVIVANEKYKASNGTMTLFFPDDGVLVTAPNAGHLMYGHVVHMDEDGNIDTITGKRVPDLFVNRKQKTRELVLEARPFAAPQNYSPWVYGANAV